jgi:hypothetical protein
MREFMDKTNKLFESTQINEMAKRTTDKDFIDMVKKAYPTNPNLSIVQLNKVAADNDVQIPTTIRHNDNYKVNSHEWNFGDSKDEFDQVKPDLSSGLGDETGTPNAEISDNSTQAGPDYDTAVKLSHAKAKEFSNLVAKGKIYVMGRKPKGAFFRVPGMDAIAAQLERMLANQLEVGDGTKSMETQYENLTQKVKLIAEGRSKFIKSLLIVGAPSSGKSFSVFKVIKDLGLKEGTDYIKKTGSISVPSLYRSLLQQIDGLVIFDDCDSVFSEDDGVNILKGALDTNPVREISLDNQRMVDVDGFTVEKRNEYADRVSKLLNDGAYTKEDDEFFRPIAKRYGIIKPSKKKKGEDSEDFDGFGNPISSSDEDNAFENDDGVNEIITFVTKRLPNKFDFRGRIIFISNLNEDEIDSAIMTRAFKVSMNFKSSEMLDFIDRIKGNINASITDEEKQEVMDYIRELYNLGRIKSAINFRLVQAAFDLRLTPDWKLHLSDM